VSFTRKVLALLIVFSFLLSVVPNNNLAILDASGYWSETRVTGVTETSISLGWNYYPSADQYEIRYGKETITENCIVITNIRTLNYTLTGLAKNTLYKIRIDCYVRNLGARYFGTLLTATTYSPKPPTPPPLTCYPITVRYYRDSISSSTYLGQVSLPSATVGTAITNVNLSFFAPSGYTVPGARSGDTYVQARENIVNVLYTKPPAPPPLTCYPITVKYYRDSISSPTYLGQVSLPSAALGTVIANVNLSLFAPSGYTIPGTRSGDAIVAARENIVYVLYTQPTPQYYPITVRYYRDSISSSTYLGQVSLPSAALGTVIANVNLSLYAPLGYAVPGTRSGDAIVAARENIVYVLYSRPQEQKYTITYLPNGGSGSMPAVSMDRGSPYVINNSYFSWPGYVFFCWNTRADGTGMMYTAYQNIIVNQDLTLYAQWLRLF
jgi:hypothetical protein